MSKEIEAALLASMDKGVDTLTSVDRFIEISSSYLAKFNRASDDNMALIEGIFNSMVATKASGAKSAEDAAGMAAASAATSAKAATKLATNNALLASSVLEAEVAKLEAEVAKVSSGTDTNNNKIAELYATAAKHYVNASHIAQNSDLSTIRTISTIKLLEFFTNAIEVMDIKNDDLKKALLDDAKVAAIAITEMADKEHDDKAVFTGSKRIISDLHGKISAKITTAMDSHSLDENSSRIINSLLNSMASAIRSTPPLHLPRTPTAAITTKAENAVKTARGTPRRDSADSVSTDGAAAAIPAAGGAGDRGDRDLKTSFADKLKMERPYSVMTVGR